MALKRLENDQGPVGNRFRQFLARHGHRGVMEFDFYAEPWDRKVTRRNTKNDDSIRERLIGPPPGLKFEY